MNKTKKGFLRAATILTIVITVFSALVSIIFFALSSKINEDFMLEDYKNDSYYTIINEADGGYIITYEENGVTFQITDEDISVSVIIFKTIVCVIAFGILLYAAAMMTLAILILVGLHKGKYKKGCTIALLILAILNQTLLISIFLVVVLALGDKKEEIQKPEEIHKDIELNKTDNVLNDIDK